MGEKEYKYIYIPAFELKAAIVSMGNALGKIIFTLTISTNTQNMKFHRNIWWRHEIDIN